jgi:hypothetical protein
MKLKRINLTSNVENKALWDLLKGSINDKKDTIDSGWIKISKHKGINEKARKRIPGK